MPRKVKVGSRIIAFPDDMSDEAISAELSKNFPNGAGPETPGGLGALDPARAVDMVRGNLPGMAGGEPLLTRPEVSPGRFTPQSPEHPHQRTARLVRENLPAIAGGAAGMATGGAGLVPAMLAIGAAGTAGAAGRGVQLALDASEGKPTPSGAFDVANDLARTGAVQGITEGLGRGAGAALKFGGHQMYRGLLKPSTQIGREFARGNTPGGDVVTARLIKEGRGMSDRGVRAADRAVDASHAKTTAMIEAAEAAGAPRINAKDATSFYPKVAEELAERAKIGQDNAVPRVGERAARIADSFDGLPQEIGTRVKFAPAHATAATGAVDAAGNPITQTVTRLKPIAEGPLLGARPMRGVGLTEGQRLKQVAQKAAHGAKRSVESGAVKELSAGDLLDDATANGLQRAIETNAAKVGFDQVGPQNKMTAELMGALRALENAVERGKNNLAVGGARDVVAAGTGGAVGAASSPGTGLGVGLLLRALSVPRVGARLAIGMDRTGRLPLAQIPRLLSSHDSEDR